MTSLNDQHSVELRRDPLLATTLSDLRYGADSIKSLLFADRATLLNVELLLHDLSVALSVCELVLAGVHGDGQEDVSRGVVLGELETAGDDIDGDDALGTHCLRGGHADETDWSRTEDHDGLVGEHVAEGVDGVCADSEGLDLDGR